MIWLMEILRIYLEEQPLIKYYAIKHLILLKSRNLMYSKEDLLRWFINFSIKFLLALILQLMALKAKLCWTKNYLNNYTNQLLENLKTKSIPIF